MGKRQLLSSTQQRKFVGLKFLYYYPLGAIKLPQNRYKRQFLGNSSTNQTNYVEDIIS